MTISYPITKNIMDQLGVERITWDIEEFKEYDVTGSGHDLDRKLAQSKWRASLVMRSLYNEAARKIAAVVRAADGRPFMIFDPSNPYPAADPGGAILGASAVLVASIGGSGAQLALKGLPAGYKLTAGDRGQIVFASGARNYYFEFSEDQTANGGGVTVAADVWPPVPAGIAVDAAVVLAKPACKMKVQRQGFAPGQSSGNMTFGTTLTLLEKV